MREDLVFASRSLMSRQAALQKMSSDAFSGAFASDAGEDAAADHGYATLTT